MKNGIKTLAVWLIIGVIMVVGISAIYDNQDRKFSYSEFIEKVQTEQVKTIDLRADGESAVVTFNDNTTEKKVNIPDVQTLMKDIETPLKEGKISLDKEGRSERDNVIEGYINRHEEDVLAEGVWQKYFTCRPAPFPDEVKRAYLDSLSGVALGSDAFFPFDDSIIRAHQSGVSFVAQPGGSIRDDIVIKRCDEFGMVMALTGIRLFHH